MNPEPPLIDRLCVNTLRALAIDMVEHANSGRPGLPLGAAPMAYLLWQRHLRHDPADPAWPDWDRFVLSAGHASPLLCGLLHQTGYDGRVIAVGRFGASTPGETVLDRLGITPGKTSEAVRSLLGRNG